MFLIDDEYANKKTPRWCLFVFQVYFCFNPHPLRDDLCLRFYSRFNPHSFQSVKDKSTPGFDLLFFYFIQLAGFVNGFLLIVPASANRS